MSYTENECLKYAVGLSQTPCDCWTEKPEDYATSDSGVYMDELLPLHVFDGLQNCTAEDTWNVLTKSLEEARKRYMSDVKAGLMKEYEAEPKFYKGKIGEAKGTVVMNSGKTYAGIILRCRPLKSGKMILNGIGGLFNTTGTKTILVYDNLGNKITEVEISTTSNVYVNNLLDVPLEIDLYSEDTEVKHIYLIYEYDTNQPLNNYLSCQYCGYTPCWNLQGDCYSVRHNNNRFFWSNYLQVSGIQINDVSELYESVWGFTSTLFGLTADVELYCDLDDIFCTDDINYRGTSYAQAQAFAIRYKACEYAITNNVLSDKLTRANLINRETMLELVAQWRNEYDALITQIVGSIDVMSTSCLRCRDKWKAQSKLARA